MSTETTTPTTPLGPKDILQEIRSLALASWVTKNDVSGFLKSTESVSDGVKIYLRSLDEKDRGPTVEQAATLIEGRVKQKEEAGVYCSVLRLAASRVTSLPLASESTPAAGKRQRRNGGQAADNSGATNGEEGSSSGKKRTRTNYPEEIRKQVVDALALGEPAKDVSTKYGVHLSTVQAWDKKRKASPEPNPSAGNGNQDGTSTSNNEGENSSPASSG